jgi:hypothetical protein
LAAAASIVDYFSEDSMRTKRLKLGIVTTVVMAGPAFGQQPLDSEMLEQEIKVLKRQYQQMEEKLNAAMDVIEESSGAKSADTNRTQIGGYGELHYNNWQNQLESGDNKREIDLHRFVLFFGHEFNERIRFFSEVELEHAYSSADAEGAVELEQAYIEFDVADNYAVKGGLFLMPVGIVNETHEPPTFYGVERNPVEKNIIPTTWWECGAAATGRFANGISADVSVTSGLMTSADSNYAVRSGRQKCSEAVANDMAVTARVKWTGVPGLELAASLQYQEDITQSQDTAAGAAILYEGHVVWSKAGLGVRALYAGWDLDGDGPSSVGADQQQGWYIEPSYRLSQQFGVFVRYNDWDNRAGGSSDTAYQQTDIGVNYWPIDDVVVKFDYQDQSAPSGSDEFDGFNLGIGYQF